jgi:hypothetical protein
MSYGEEAVGLAFNPSGDPQVKRIKVCHDDRLSSGVSAAEGGRGVTLDELAVLYAETLVRRSVAFKPPKPRGYGGAFQPHVGLIMALHRQGKSAVEIAAAVPPMGRDWLDPGAREPLSPSMVRYILRRQREEAVQ